MKFRHRCVMVACSPEVDDENLPLESETRDGCDIGSFRQGGTLSVPREEATVLESFLEEHGGWKAFLWTPPYEWRQIKVTCAKWSSRVSMLRVEFSAEFEQVVN